MRRYFLVFIMIFSGSQLHAGILDSLSVGLGGGYDSYNTLRGEVYLKSEIELFKRKSELKAGMNNRSYQLEFDGVKGLNAQSLGFFGDITIYPFNKGLFTGIRWELINFNWLTPDSKTKIETEKQYSPTSLYTGSCMFFQLGYDFQLSDKMGLKLYCQPGFQQFKITNGSSSSGGYVQGSTSANLISEDHSGFIYNINLSIEFKLK
jgi:hypothetical protein